MSQGPSNPPFADVEVELSRHPDVQDCAVTEVRTGARHTVLTAYVVTTARTEPAELRSFLAGSVPSRRIPAAIVPVRSLPRVVDYAALPLPVLREHAAGGKGGARPQRDGPDGATAAGVAGGTLFFAFLAFVLTDVFWPRSTELSGVPQPWATFFFILYVCECLSFGLGIAFLVYGPGLMARRGRPRWLTALAYPAVAWLLTAWWPQDNFYRLAAKTDWPRQTALVYVFNISLMVAAAVVAAYVAGPGDRER